MTPAPSKIGTIYGLPKAKETHCPKCKVKLGRSIAIVSKGSISETGRMQISRMPGYSDTIDANTMEIVAVDKCFQCGYSVK